MASSSNSKKSPYSKRLLHRYLKSQVPNIPSTNLFFASQRIDTSEEFDDDDCLRLPVPIVDHSVPTVSYAIDALGSMLPDLIKRRRDLQSSPLHQPPILSSDGSSNLVEFLEWIDNGHLHPSLLPILSDRQVQFYDGSIVIEVQDYRNISVSLSTTKARSDILALSDPPEVHRILLRPNEASISVDIQLYLDSTIGEGLWSDEQFLELEKGIRNSTATPLCLDPSPGVSQIVNFIRFQGCKYKLSRPDSFSRAKKVRQMEIDRHLVPANVNRNEKPFFGPKLKLAFELEKPTASSLTLDQRLFGIPVSSIFGYQSIIDTLRQSKHIRELETFSGLDARTNNTEMNMRKSLPPISYTINVIANNENQPEVILRYGSSQDKSDKGGEMIRFRLASPHLIETYMLSAKALIIIQDARMKITCDLTNPSAYQYFFQQKNSLVYHN